MKKKTVHKNKSNTPTSRVRSVFDTFAKSEVTGSILLLASALIALVWANSAWAESYFSFIDIKVGFVFGDNKYLLTVHQVINDALMGLFFLVVGLEIKRELFVGELSSVRKAALPFAAAFGGMVFPAIIYMVFNLSKPGSSGWGIPMATDIAFSLGVLALLGSRVPTSLKVFLTALAIVDDLGAVLVITFFYSEGIAFLPLCITGLFLLAIVISSRLGIRRIEIYILLGLGVWGAVFFSGIHATVAGVLIAMTVPVKLNRDPVGLLQTIKLDLHELELAELSHDSMIHDRRQFDAIDDLYNTTRSMRPVGLALEEYLHPLLVWFVLPLFALFNAGVRFDMKTMNALFNPITIGIVFGLVLGKQLGVTLFSFLAVRLKLASLPEHTSWRLVYGVSWLCGIGFTMSLFVTELAFEDPVMISSAKIGILFASFLAGVVGYILLRFWLPERSFK